MEVIPRELWLTQLLLEAGLVDEEQVLRAERF